MTTPPRARYVGYTKGTENHGDEALMTIVARLLAPEIEVVFDTEVYDVAFLGGGTLINQSPWLIDHFGSALDQAPLGGFAFGTGVGDTTFWGDHLAAWKRLLDRCPFVGVRGPRSLALLLEAGVSHAETIGDPYLSLRPAICPAHRPRLLGVNCGSTNDALWGGDDRAYFDFLHTVLQRLRDAKWDFLFLSVWSKDLPLVTALRDRLGLAEAPVLDARVATPKVLERLSACEVFLGEKLHACAMAAVAEVPFIALEYQPKVLDFAESLGFASQARSTADRDPDSLIALVQDIAANRAPLRIQLQTNLETQRHHLADFTDRLKRHTLARHAAAGGHS